MVVLQNSDALFLKSNYEYVRGNYQKAINLLYSAHSQTTSELQGQPLAALFYNNLCCIHFKLRKYNLGILYARKALEDNIQELRNLPSIEKGNLLKIFAIKFSEKSLNLF